MVYNVDLYQIITLYNNYLRILSVIPQSWGERSKQNKSYQMVLKQMAKHLGINLNWIPTSLHTQRNFMWIDHMFKYKKVLQNGYFNNYNIDLHKASCV